MQAQVKGVVFKSMAVEGKEFYKTAITQREQDLQTTVVSTINKYKPGDKIDILARVSVSMFRDKAYMVVIEEKKDEPEKPGDAAKK